MKAKGFGNVLLALAVFTLAAVLYFGGKPQPAYGLYQDKSGAARYSVIETEGTNLIVTDNQSNTLYFYVVDKEQPAGADLKLRGSLDLTKCGDMVLKPKVYKHEGGKEGDK